MKATAWMAIGLTLSVLGGCAKKVDCDKFARRASGECQVAMLLYVFDIKPGMVVLAKKKPCFQRFFKKGVKIMCKKSRRTEAQEAEVAECLAKKDCKAFAVCYRAVMIKHGWMQQFRRRRTIRMGR